MIHQYVFVSIILHQFYLLIYFFCIKNINYNSSIFTKIVIGCCILLLSALLLREYYILTSFFSLVIYLLFCLIVKRVKNKKERFLALISTIVGTVLIFMFVISVCFPLEYSIVIDLRRVAYSYMDGYTDSIISDFIDNSTGSVVIYTINYFINFIRLLIPVELIIGKWYYIPYIVYQLYFTKIYLSKLADIDILCKRKFLTLIFITSYIMVAAMMEPDFGSWVRHQSILWCLILELYVENDFEIITHSGEERKLLI